MLFVFTGEQANSMNAMAHSARVLGVYLHYLPLFKVDDHQSLEVQLWAAGARRSSKNLYQGTIRCCTARTDVEGLYKY